MSQYLILNSFNARGLGDGRKRRCNFKWLKKLHPGVCLLQETHSTEAIESTWNKEWGSQIFFSHGSTKSKGVAVLFPAGMGYKVNNVLRDDNGRYIILDIDFEHSNVILLNVYAPTKDKIHEQLNFLQQLQTLLINYQDRNIVLAGDFNTYLNHLKDKKGGRAETLSDYSRQLKSSIDELGLADVWRVANPDESRFTWRNYTRGGFVQSRIDYFFISTHMLYDLAESDIKPGIKSDHSLLKLKFKFTDEHVRGKGFWKFNSSLLYDKDYVNYC